MADAKQVTDAPNARGGGEDKNGGLLRKALGPAAEQFGQEVAPVGQRGGQVAKRVFEMFCDSVDTWVTQKKRVKEVVGEELTKRLEHVEQEKVVPPNPRIAVPTLEGLSLALDEEQIREMYLNLLAADMNSDTKSSTHPGFSAVIREMTAAEAKLLKVLRESPEIEFEIRVRCGNRSRAIAKVFSFNVEGVKYDQARMSISNLERLGLLTVRLEHYPIRERFKLIEEEIEQNYKSLRESLHEPAYKTAYRDLGDDLSLDIKKHGIYLTPFGELFVAVCLK